MKRTLRFVTLAAAIFAAVQLSTPAIAQWTSIHRSSDNNRFAPSGPSSLNVTTTGSFTTGEQDIHGNTAVLNFSGKIITVARTTSPTCNLKAFDADSGVLLWTSPNLDSTANTFSLSVPAADIATQKLYFNTGITVYRIDAVTGAIDWQTPLNSGNTDPGPNGRYSFTNASPALGGGRVYVQTYETNFGGPYNDSQVVALNAATGTVAWWTKVGGVGSVQPVYADTGTTQILLAAGGTAGGQGRFVGLSPVNGGVVWSSDSALPSWTTTDLAWGDFVLSGSNFYTTTYNFSGTNGRLIAANIVTGALAYNKPAITTDSPPIVIGGSAYLFGGSFGAPQLAKYNLATGDVESTVSTGGVTFRQYPAAVANRIYLSSGSPVGLKVFDPATLGTIATFTHTITDGPITIGTDNRVYARPADGGSVIGWLPTASAQEWLRYE